MTSITTTTTTTTTNSNSSSSSSAGYANAIGIIEARIAIAKHHRDHQTSKRSDDDDDDDERGKGSVMVTPDDVIIANGVSGALELALSSLLDDDTALLGKFFRPRR
jgi:tyrosine aminotransferase